MADLDKYREALADTPTDDLIEEIQSLCDDEGGDWCAILDDYYAGSIHKENPLRPVVISAKRTAAAAKHNPTRTVIIVLIIAALVGAGAWYYFSIYKKQ